MNLNENVNKGQLNLDDYRFSLTVIVTVSVEPVRIDPPVAELEAATSSVCSALLLRSNSRTTRKTLSWALSWKWPPWLPSDDEQYFVII